MGKKTLWAVILLLLTAPLYAHDFNFSWVEPTTRTDGTALNPATEIKSYKMRCEGPENAERIVDRAVTNAILEGRRQYNWIDAVQASGLYNCKMSAIDTGDLESPWSNTVSGIPRFDPPAPPTDFRRNE